MTDAKCKADAWSIKKMSNHVTRLRSRAANQRHREIHLLADTLQAIYSLKLFGIVYLFYFCRFQNN